MNPLHGVERSRCSKYVDIVVPSPNPLHGVERGCDRGLKTLMELLGIHYMELKVTPPPTPSLNDCNPLNPLHGVEREHTLSEKSSTITSIVNPLHGVERGGLSWRRGLGLKLRRNPLHGVERSAIIPLLRSFLAVDLESITWS